MLFNPQYQNERVGSDSRLSIRAIVVGAIAISLAFVLAACSPQTQPDSSSSASTASSYGSPWITSVFTGNLPKSQPEAKDDLYLHYAYEFASAHQDGTYASAANEGAGELQAAVTSAISDSSIDTSEMKQLRIFYNQAADIETREAAGADELKPYLKAVAATQSLDELESLMLSDDFPFSPWIETTVAASNMKETMCVAVMPNMLFSDSESGSDFYQDAETPEEEAAYEAMKSKKMITVRDDIVMISIEDDEKQAAEKANKMFELEKGYGKDENPNHYLDAEYGSQAQVVKSMSLDEFCSTCPNFPMRETLAKLGEDRGDTVVVMYPQWVSSFNDIWTEENFELLRDMTEVKVLQECADLIAPSFFSGTRAELGQTTPTSDEAAYVVCDKTNTFSQLLAKIYVERELGGEVVDELSRLSNDLIDDYIELVGQTSWLAPQTRENIIDKIDNIALNVLYPDGGYFDYSELKLIPTEEGGTLLSNYLLLKAYNDKLEAELIGQPARASSTWLYIRPTAQNCFYDPVSNSINIFPGYVTTTTYKKDMSCEELLATMGFVMGHEISHAFDYTGSQFDAYGQPIPVFSDVDVKEFTDKRQDVADYYSTFESMPGVFVNGKKKSAEATADLCGMQVILARAGKTEGFNYEKMFSTLASSCAMVASPAYANVLLTNSHALNNQRVNASAQMFDEFYDTYKVAEGDVMYLAPDARLAMWGKNSG